MRKKFDSYYIEHGLLSPSFDLIFTGKRATVSIKHPKTIHQTGHISTDYGFFFWVRLMFAIKRCYTEQINHRLSDN